MSSAYDFNIDNYTLPDLEKFLKLSKNYNEYEVRDKEGKIRNQLLQSFSKSTKYKKLEKSAISFLEEARRLLIESLSKTRMLNMGDNRLIINKNDAPDSVMSYMQPVTSFPTSVAQGNLNKLKKRTTTYSLCMNTLFRDCITSKDGNIMFVLPYPLKNVVSLKLVSLEFPDTVYMLSDQKRTNRLYIKDEVTENGVLIIIPEGNYNSETFPDVLQSAINTAFETTNQYTVAIDEINGKTTISSSGNAFSMEFINGSTSSVLSKNIGWYMGFRYAQYCGQTTYTSDGIFSPIPLPYIYFVLNDFNIASSTTIMGIFIDNYVEKNILAKIPIPVDSFQVMFDNNSDLISKKREYFGPVDLSKFSIKILDQYGEIIDLNNMDYSFTLELEIVYDI